MAFSTKLSIWLVLGTALPGAVAHIALWHPSLYGWKEDEPNQNDACNPLQQMNFDQWWFHGWIDSPPATGEIMELPAGGTFTGQLGCNKAFTTYDPQQYACNTIGPLHTNDTSFGDDPKDVKGCAIAIAYKSDPHDIQPDDFTVISVNYTCPWVRETDFHIPSDLPACPPGGCNCMWGWVHSQYAGTTQIYFLGYKCNVTGATGVTPLPRPQVARKCPVDKSNCTVGSKQPHYWLQNEGNNNFQGNWDPPFWLIEDNGDYGFQNGAQADLYASLGEAAPESAPSPLPSATAGTTTTSSSLAQVTSATPTSVAQVQTTVSSASTTSATRKAKQCKRSKGHLGRRASQYRRATHGHRGKMDMYP